MQTTAYAVHIFEEKTFDQLPIGQLFMDKFDTLCVKLSDSLTLLDGTEADIPTSLVVAAQVKSIIGTHVFICDAAPVRPVYLQ